MRTTLIYRLLVIALIILSLSCQKDADGDPGGSAYFLKFKKNGTWVNYTLVEGESGPTATDPNTTYVQVFGGSNDQNETLDISVQVDGNNVPAGTYVSDNYYVQVSYFTGYTGTNDLIAFMNDNAPSREPSKYTITITTITATEIAGNFTGNYLYNLTPGRGPEDIINITEGSFRVKRIR